MTFPVIRSLLTKCSGALILIDASRMAEGTHDQDFFGMKMLSYLGELGNETDVVVIGKLLDEDCRGICHPMYCVLALEQLGNRAAIPYLERAVARHQNSRRKVSIETRTLAAEALEALL